MSRIPLYLIQFEFLDQVFELPSDDFIVCFSRDELEIHIEELKEYYKYDTLFKFQIHKI